MEEWRAAPGYEGLYEVSDRGRVRRVKRAPHTRPGYILKLSPNGRDYLRCSLHRDGRTRCIRVSVLVAAAFLGPCPEGYEVNHRDGDKANNLATNLEYLTHPRNMRHAAELGLMRRRPGISNGPKLSEADVRAIRALPPEVSGAEIGRRYGITSVAANDARLGRTWKHV